jgi:mannan endo-1,4-beta-mannosidase
MRLARASLPVVLALTGCLVPRGPQSAPWDESDAPLEPVDQPSATFRLGGAPFCFLGANNYYMTYKSRAMTDEVIQEAQAMGLKVLRVWGFLDRGALDGSVANVHEEGAKEGVYFQYWDPARRHPAYNDGSSGLEHLDYLLDRAGKAGLKVMLVLTNNWKDFGGMEQYLVWYGLDHHEAFYTDERVTGAFKDWIAHLVQRRNAINGVSYRDDPTVFAWELANEPRAAGAPGAITSWADQMSTFIKSIDPHHMVSVGDEGFLSGGTGFGHDGSEGVDHAALLGLAHVDFGTYHLYPDTWKQADPWGTRWIDEHLALARAQGKPTLLEEYGVTLQRDGSSRPDEERRSRAYARWYDALDKRGGSGALLWMLAGRDDRGGRYPDFDHFTVYRGDRVASWLGAAAPRFASEARACRLAPTRRAGGTASAFVTWSAPAQ